MLLYLEVMLSQLLRVLVCGWFIKYLMDNHAKETEKFTTMMLAYKDEFKDAINNNTRAMEKLTSSIIFEKKGGKKDEIE